MKVEPDPLVPDAYLRVRGVVYVRQTRWGPIAQKWPRKSPHGMKAGDRWRRVEFGLIAAATKNAMDLDVIMATNVAKGTNLVPRDILMKMMTGKLYIIHTSDGQTWESWRMTVPNVQDVLEQLGSNPQALIVRGSEFWQEILAGNLNDVLTMTNAGPQWQAPPSGGGGGGNSNQWSWPADLTSTTGRSEATKGNVFQLTENVTLKSIALALNVANIGDEFSAFVAVVDGSLAIQSTLATAVARYTATATGLQTITFDMPANTTLSAGIRYLVAGVITNRTTSTSVALIGNSVSDAYTNMPLDLGAMRAAPSGAGAATLATYAQNSDAPASGSSTHSSANSYGVGLKFQTTQD